jgi:hypothetical protein
MRMCLLQLARKPQHAQRHSHHAQHHTWDGAGLKAFMTGREVSTGMQ